MDRLPARPAPTHARLGAWVLAAACLAGTAPAPAFAQEGLQLTLEPSVTLRHPDLPLNLQPPPALDLSLHWSGGHGSGNAFELIAGRQVGGLGLQPGVPAFASIKREPISLRELTFIGVQFQGGARLTLRRRGDGLGLPYRATF